MENIIIIAVVGLILAAVIIYIVKAKKKGVKCIGCADAKGCSKNCSACTSCNHEKK